MKKLFIIMVSVLAITACSTSVENKIKNSAYEEVKGKYKEPFDTLSVVIDTSFVLYNSDLKIALYKISEDVRELEYAQKKVTFYQSLLDKALSEGRRSPVFERELSHAKDEYDRLDQKWKEKKAKIENVIEANKGIAQYKVIVRYRRGVDESSNILYYDKNGKFLDKFFPDFDYEQSKEILEKWGFKI